MKIFFISILICLITNKGFSQDKYSILNKYLLNHPIRNICNDDFYILRKVKPFRFDHITSGPESKNKVESNRRANEKVSMLAKKYFCDYIDTSRIDRKLNIKVHWSKYKVKANSKRRLTWDDLDKDICFVLIGRPIILLDNYLILIEEYGAACAQKAPRITDLSLYKIDTNNNLSKIRSIELGGIVSPCFR